MFGRGDDRRDRGIASVTRHYSRWHRDAVDTLRRIALHQDELTADDLWDRLQQLPPTPNAVGSVFRIAMAEGVIAATERTVRSQRSARHAGRVLVWRSLLYGRAS